MSIEACFFAFRRSRRRYPSARSGSPRRISVPVHDDLTSSNDEEVTALQRLLHHGKSGPLPQNCMVRAALAMARDMTLTLTVACDQAGVEPGSRARTAQVCDRVKDEGLLDIVESTRGRRQADRRSCSTGRRRSTEYVIRHLRHVSDSHRRRHDGPEWRAASAG